MDMILNVSKDEYEELKSGKKHIEYVACNRYWAEKIASNLCRGLTRPEMNEKRDELLKKGTTVVPTSKNNGCSIHKGYTNEYIKASIGMATVIDGSKAKPVRSGLTIMIYFETIESD